LEDFIRLNYKVQTTLPIWYISHIQYVCDEVLAPYWIIKHLVRTLHNGGKEGIDQQIFNKKSISRKIMHPPIR